MCWHTRKSIFFAQLVGRVQLTRYKERKRVLVSKIAILTLFAAK